MLIEKKFLTQVEPIKSISIDKMEYETPLFEITYPNSKKGYFVACRHFMYYGKTGDSYREFRNTVLKMLDVCK